MNNNFEKKMFLLLKFGKNNIYEYSVFIKMKFVFQEMHKDPKHPQLLKIQRKFSHDCYMFKQQYKMQVLKCCCSFTQYFMLLLVSIFTFTTIYPQYVFALHLCSLCIILYILCSGMYFMACTPLQLGGEGVVKNFRKVFAREG